MSAKWIMIVSAAVLGLGLVTLSCWAAEGDSLWSHTYGGSGSDVAIAIIPSGDGGFLLAGSTYSFGAGWNDMWLVKVNANGDSLWSRTYGGSGNDCANAIIPSGDGGFLLAGWTTSFGSGFYDMWLVKVNAEGESLWSRTYGGSNNDQAYSIIPSGDGGFLLAGYTNSFGSGSDDMWLVKVNTQGDSLWSRTYGDGSGAYAHSIVSTSDSCFILAGFTWAPGGENVWLVKVNNQGDSLDSHSLGGNYHDWANAIIPSNDGNFMVAGVTNSTFSGQDLWVLKINSNLDTLWTFTFDENNFEKANSITTSNDGNFVIAGSSALTNGGNPDVLLVKMSAQGSFLWSRTYGGNFTDLALSVIPAEDGNFLLAGQTNSFGAGGGDMWLVKVEGPNMSAPLPVTSHPAEFALHPPHPNPFNPTTVLSFELPVASLVKLEVFDINGRNVGARRAAPLLSGSGATPTMQETRFLAGIHQITFDGSDLPSGIYLARLTAGNWLSVQKLVLMK